MVLVKDLVGMLANGASYIKEKIGKGGQREALADDYAKATAVGYGLLHSENPDHRALAMQFAREYDAWIARMSFELLENKRAGIKALIRATADEADTHE